MQAENNCIDRQSGLQLIQNFITQFLECLPLEQAARFRPCGGAFDDRQSFRRCALAQCHDGRRA